MIKMIRSEEQAKKYLKEVQKLFDLCKYKEGYKIDEEYISEKFSNILKKIDKGVVKITDPVKRKVIVENLMGESTLTDIANQTNYSTSYIYVIKQKVLKEFAMILFEVVILC